MCIAKKVMKVNVKINETHPFEILELIFYVYLTIKLTTLFIFFFKNHNF